MAASLFRQEGGDDWLSTLSVARIKSSDLTAVQVCKMCTTPVCSNISFNFDDSFHFLVEKFDDNPIVRKGILTR